MQADFRPPKRRSRVREEYEGPLPVSRDPGQSSEFRGELINQHVLVCQPDHITKIHNQVCRSVCGLCQPEVIKSQIARNRKNQTDL